MKPARVAVLGAGSWGTALGLLLAKNGHAPVLWARDEELATAIRDRRCNPRYLPEIELRPEVDATSDLERCLRGAEVVVCAIPSRSVREVMEASRSVFPADALVVSGTKGIEIESGLRMSQVMADVLSPDLDEEIVALSGPSFADELARELPTAVAAASFSEARSRACQRLFQNDHLRVYTQRDPVGTELGAALKNVIALAAGISDGLRLGNNARAALLTRGLAEIGRLVRVLGGEEQTLAGLAGVGDLVLTCTGDLSRNRRAGLAIGRGRTREEALEEVREVVEGVPTTRAGRSLARRHGVEMPIVEAVYSILFEGVSPREVLARLMAREPKPERWS